MRRAFYLLMVIVVLVLVVLLATCSKATSVASPILLDNPTSTSTPIITVKSSNEVNPTIMPTSNVVMVDNPTITPTTMNFITFAPLDTAMPAPSSTSMQVIALTQILVPTSTSMPLLTSTLEIEPIPTPTYTPVPIEVLERNVYYMAVDGDDNNPGTASQPWATWQHASSVLQAGDTLRLYSGTYNQILRVRIDDITIEPANGRPLISQSSSTSIKVESDGVILRGLEVTNANNSCIVVSGSNVVVEDNTVHDCWEFGISIGITASDVIVRNNRVYRTVLENQDRDMSGGWASGLKVRGARDVLIENNVIYRNWGEGIAARGYNLTIRGNVAYDNFGANIYSGHPVDTVIERNMSYCTLNGEMWFRNGHPPIGIGIAEEAYSDMKSQLKNVTIVNNIVDGCYRGIVYGGSESSGGGLDHVLIAHNTLVNIIERGIGISDEPVKTQNVVIANNLVQAGTRGAVVRVANGVVCHHNLWVNGDNIIGCSGAGDVTGAALLDGHYVPQSGSPAIDAGESVGVFDDYSGNGRSDVPDIGALEFDGH